MTTLTTSLAGPDRTAGPKGRFSRQRCRLAALFLAGAR
jgi:hypothetical protein